jgi:Phosphotransferase enzyme family
MGGSALERARFAGDLSAKVGRIVVCAVGERVRRQPLRSTTDVPRTPDDLTPEWLTACLCGDHPGAAVTAIENLGGTTGTSTRRRLRVAYNDAGRAAGLQEHLYAKTTTTITQRLILGLTGIIEVEGQSYERALPLVDIEAPRGYFASFDPRSWRSFVLTEDVAATRGAEFFSPQSELTRDQTKELLTAMARWHGTLWEHPVLAGGWLQTTAERQVALSRFLDWGKRSAVGFKRVGSELPAFALQRHEEAVRAFARSMQLGSAGPMTFLHGDPHSGGNFYVTREERMGWADWGVCLRGSWGYDYSYFITASLPVEHRREWERELLGHYLEELANAGGEPPTFEDAWLIYRQQMIYPFIAWGAVYGHGPLQPDSQPPEFCVPIIVRTAHAVQDHDAIDAVLNPPPRPRRPSP